MADFDLSTADSLRHRAHHIPTNSSGKETVKESLKKEDVYMSRCSSKPASFFSVLIATLIFSLSLAGVAAAQSKLNNTRLGKGALDNNTTGFDNTAIGADALFLNNTGSENTATGGNALQSNTTGENNTASGVNALFSSTTSSLNTADGFQALFHNTTGDQNTAIGVQALFSNTTRFFFGVATKRAL